MYDTPSAQADPLIGRRIANRYEILERIGTGATSLVYRARQWPIGRLVAVKILVPDPAAHGRSVRRFVNEARILSRLRHPNTLGLIDFGRTDDGNIYTVTDYVGGGTLGDLMAGRRVSPTTALRLARDLARALAEAHAHGVIHRDLKPENVLLDAVRGGEVVPRLADFGLAKEQLPGAQGTPSEVTHPRTRLGTPGYMAPEQAFFEPVDPTADLYALGAILYEMLTGHPVFTTDSRDDLYFAHRYEAPPPFAQTAPDLHVGEGVETLVMQLLAKSSEARPESADAVVARLEALLDDAGRSTRVRTLETTPRAARPTALVEPPPPVPRRHPMLTGALVAAALVVLTVILV